MDKRYIWKILFVLIALSILWLVGKGLFESWGYFRLSRTAPAQIEKWEIVEYSPSKFTYRAEYFFDASGKKFRGIYEFKRQPQLNVYAAEEELKSLKEKRWMVWFDPTNPAVNTLDKKSPFKAILYGLVGLGLFFYFVWVYRKMAFF